MDAPLAARLELEVLYGVRHVNARAIDPRFGGMDPFSSAWWFDGWHDDEWREGLKPPDVRTVAAAETWLLRVGWRRHGLLRIDEVPPAARH